MKTTILVAFLVPGALAGQAISRLSSPLPLWADSALLSSGFWQGYDFSSRVSPEIESGDLDGDGLWDLAIGVVDKAGHRHGIAVIHQIDRSVHILGAGQPAANGRDELPSTARWALGRLIAHRTGIRIEDGHASGWFVWKGGSYVWVQDSE